MDQKQAAYVREVQLPRLSRQYANATASLARLNSQIQQRISQLESGVALVSDAALAKLVAQRNSVQHQAVTLQRRIEYKKRKLRP